MPRFLRTDHFRLLPLVAFAALVSPGCDGGVGAGVPDNRVATSHTQQSQEDMTLAPGDAKAIEIIEAPIDPAERSYYQE